MIYQIWQSVFGLWLLGTFTWMYGLNRKNVLIWLLGMLILFIEVSLSIAAGWLHVC